MLIEPVHYSKVSIQGENTPRKNSHNSTILRALTGVIEDKFISTCRKH